MNPEEKQRADAAERPPGIVALDGLGAVRARGPDAVRFLQGQVSSDVTELGTDRSQLAGYHNPQGRAIALLRLVPLAADDILAILPRELAAAVTARLRRYVLRAKVEVLDESDAWSIRGLTIHGEAPRAGDLALPGEAGALARDGDLLAIRLTPSQPRWLIVCPKGSAREIAGTVRYEPRDWHAADIAAGLPQVYAATSEAFVAQMLNLDAIGAVAFDKGCYTGQEIIARAHYRGRIKRRMQRFVTAEGAGLAPGTAGRLSDGRSMRVVDAVELGGGRCEFLAVTAVGGGADEAPAEGAAHTIAAESLPLPYALPD